MVILLVAGFMNLIDVTIVNVALPSMQKALAATTSQIEWVVAVYILVFALGLLPAGRMGDIIGRQRMFNLGVGVFTLGSAACGLAPSIETLLAARVLQAIGGAMMTPQTLAIVPALFAPHERGLPFALFGLSAGLASVSGPLLGGVLIEQDIWGLGWRPIFLVNLPVGMAAIALALRYLPKMPGNPRLKNDFIGIALAGLALLMVVFPLIEGRQAGWPLWFFAVMVGALPVAGLFVTWQFRQEARGQAQVLPGTLMRNGTYLLGAMLAAVMFSGIPGFFLVLAQYLQLGYGLDALHSGLTTVPFSVGVLVASIISGSLGARMPRQRITLGALCLTAAMVWLGIVVQATSSEVVWLAFMGPLLLGGIGLGTTISPLYQVVLGAVSGQDTGSASGALQALQQVGGALGVAIVGEIFFSRLAGLNATDPHPAFASAMTHALIYNTVCFAVIAAGVWCLPAPRAAALGPSPAKA